MRKAKQIKTESHYFLGTVNLHIYTHKYKVETPVLGHIQRTRKDFFFVSRVPIWLKLAPLTCRKFHYTAHKINFLTFNRYAFSLKKKNTQSFLFTWSI